jgi:hypothetical protein
MKLAFRTDTYGGRTVIQPDWGGTTLFFLDKEPPPKTLITLDLPGCKNPSAKEILKWIAAQPSLIARVGATLKRGESRRALSELPASCWRLMQIEDVLDISNHDRLYSGLSEQFGLPDLIAFADRAWPDLRERFAKANAVSEPTARAKALRTVVDRAMRVAVIANHSGAILSADADRTLLPIEKAAFDALAAQKPMDLKAWATFIRRVHDAELFARALQTVGGRLAALDDSDAIVAALTELRQHVGSDEHRFTDSRLWQPIEKRIKLDATETRGTFDLSDAVQVRVTAGFEVLAAKRVGPVRIGRMALVIAQRPRVYIAGERRLKFEIERAGGKLKRYGVTLTNAKRGRGVVQKALLEVDLLDSLAQLDPAQALARVDDLNLPAAHPIRAAAAQALDSIPHRRVLADMLIELRTGLDPEIARRMAREQSKR